MKSIRYIILLLIVASPTLVGWGSYSPFQDSALNVTNTAVGSSGWLQEKVSSIHYQADNLDVNVLKLSLNAYAKARSKGLDNKRLLTIIDYSKPSNERRLWVVDVLHSKVLYNTWVTHGKNSGAVNATSFSNQVGSLKSSLGVFLTDSAPYMGGNGYSLRMIGLEPGINDNAYRRSTVFHGAAYASPEVAKRYGGLGRSWGCPAVDKAIAKPFIDTIKNRTVVVAYYPDHKWLSQSRWVG
ncbi:MAG: murein L,D-transpeptidase catalytic domain family protein [Gammaproteobacteria bacterium]|nr:murein L,D-transpeptidase catalytic domain family protein [Gammaproteobacteria bacterium]